MEWVADWYDRGYYSASPPSNPTGPATGVNLEPQSAPSSDSEPGLAAHESQSRVLRGGSIPANSGNEDVRSASREWAPSSVVALHVFLFKTGFRCARSSSP